MTTATVADIFKAYDVRSTYPDMINTDAAWRVGYAAGQYLLNRSGLTGGARMLVSRDMRPHSPELCDALVLGIRANGIDVVDLGMCDTSFMYFAINHIGENVIGGIQTTASHNPINYNGFKISAQKAVPVGAESGLNDIRDAAAALPHDAGADQFAPTGGYEKRDLWEEYREHVLQFVTPPTRKLTAFIDACNGMGGKLVPQIFDDIPNVETIDLNFAITGSFVHEPNPLVAENMEPTQQGVIENNCDLGVCFDGDADRCILTDEKGNIIGCDHLTALLAEYFLKQDPGSTIVYDLRSSKSVEETITRLGGKAQKGRVGHVFMKEALRKSGGIFGGELSGHFYFRDNFYTDSGAITFAVVLTILGQTDKPLSELIAPYQTYPQSGERNFRVEDKDGVMQSLREQYANGATVEELDGVSIDAWDTKGWWFNVRASNTEPLLRLNAEAKDQETLDALLADLTPQMGEPDTGGH